MKHYGDITKISGYDLEPVDVITGGSPCQDLSVAGKRAGLAGERSGLFMEQIRIIREMREEEKKRGRADDSIRPRYMVWENVAGAFSSNGGKDFAAVLEETVKIIEPEIPNVPVPDGGWPYSGCLYDGMGRWSVAWRLHDAQFWGVPQRRKRISLVADFGGLSAAEISFERKGMQWHPAEGGEAREGTPTATRDIVKDTGDGSIISFQERAGKPGGGKGILIQKDRVGALSTVDNQRVLVYGICSDKSNAMLSDNPHSGIYIADTARTLDNNGGSPACNQGGMAVVCLNDQGGSMMDVTDGLAATLRAQNHGHLPVIVAYPLEGNGQRPSHQGDGCWSESDKGYTLNGTEKHAVAVVYDARGNGDGDICPTITGDHQNRVTDYTALCIGNGQLDQLKLSEKVGALNCMHDQQAVLIYTPSIAHTLKSKANLQFREDAETYICYGFKGGQSDGGIGYAEEKAPTLSATPSALEPTALIAAVDCRNGTLNEGINGTLQAKEQGYNLNSNNVVLIWPEVRRLTPTECERLQGFPDGWTDIGEWTDSKGKKRQTTDSNRYKALGNSIALPYWKVLARRISAQYDRDITIGSLFDGIGGFPLAFEHCGGKAVWASEIEEFPIAVTKRHFPE